MKSIGLALTAHVLHATALEHHANPIRKVVSLLQNMEKKVSSEGEKEKEIFDKYMCYCKNGAGALAKSIADAGNKMPELESAIAEGESRHLTLKAEIKAHQTERAAAKTAIAEATAVRAKEAAVYAKDSTEGKTNLAAMKKAVEAISSGMDGSFLQTAAAGLLRKIILAKDNMNDGDRQEIVSFLSDREEYAPASGEIVGILKQMADETAKDLEGLDANEKSSISSFDAMIAAKNKEVQAATKMIEAKLGRVGELGVEIAEMKNDLGDTGESLIEDKKFAQDLDKNCAEKQKLFGENVKMRGQEILALQDTIKLLNSDDALELFKKTLPGASSFMQVQVSNSEMRTQALEIVRAVAKGSPRRAKFDFITLALNGKKIGFGKVIKMIDGMVATLTQEQLDDADKKEYCDKQLESTADKKKGLERDISDLETAIVNAKEAVQTLVGEIDALGDGIRDLDKQVADATENRKEEASDYTTLMASDAAAAELLGFAKNRLNKFYNPKLATALMQDAPAPPPESIKAYKKSSEDSNGVIAMIDLLVKDLDKEMTEAEVIEKNAQEDYEQTMGDAAKKRTQDTKSLTDKEEASASLASQLQTDEEGKKTTIKELMATERVIGDLHAECDWLIKYYDVRAEARTGEIEAMKTCKAVLSGADYSLLQTKSKSFLRLH